MTNLTEKEVTNLFFSKKYSEMLDEELNIINSFMPKGGFKKMYDLAMDGSESDQEKINSYMDYLDKISKENYLIRFISGRSFHSVKITQVIEMLESYHDKIVNDIISNKADYLTDISETSNWYFGSQVQKQELAEIVKLLTEY